MICKMSNFLLFLFFSFLFHFPNFSFASKSIPFGYHLEKLTKKEISRLKSVNNGKEIKIKYPGLLENLKDRKKFLTKKN